MQYSRAMSNVTSIRAAIVVVSIIVVGMFTLGTHIAHGVDALAPTGAASTETSPAIQQLNDTAREGLGITQKDDSENPLLIATIGKIVSVILSLLGVLFFGLMLYGGFLWMTARGNTDQVEKAQSLIRQAVIGLVVIFAAYAITVFVTDALIGTIDTTQS